MNKAPGDHFKTARSSANRLVSAFINDTCYLLKQIPLMHLKYLELFYEDFSYFSL